MTDKLQERHVNTKIHLAWTIRTYRVPDAMILGFVETSNQLVPSVKKTRIHKVEEDLGPIEENFTGNVNEYIEPEFEIDVMSDLEAESVDEAVEDSSSDEEDEAEEEEEVVVQPNVRQRKPSTMNGSIKKGKYSR